MIRRCRLIVALITFSGLLGPLGVNCSTTRLASGAEGTVDIESARVGWAGVARDLEQRHRQQPDDLTTLRNLIVAYTRLSVLERGTARGANLCQLIPDRIEQFRKAAGTVSSDDDAVLHQCTALLAFQVGLYPVVSRQIEELAGNDEAGSMKRALRAVGQSDFSPNGELTVPCGAGKFPLAVWRLNGVTTPADAGSVFHYYFLPSFGAPRDIPRAWLTLGSQQVGSARRYYLYGHQGHHRKPLKIYGTSEPSYEQLTGDVTHVVASMAGNFFERGITRLSGRGLVLLILGGAVVALALVQAMRRGLSGKTVSQTAALPAILVGAAIAGATYVSAQPADSPQSGSERLVIPPEATALFDEVDHMLNRAGIPLTQPTEPPEGAATLPSPAAVPAGQPALPAQPVDPPLLPVLGPPTSPDKPQPPVQPDDPRGALQQQFAVIHAAQQRIAEAADAGQITREFAADFTAHLSAKLQGWEEAQQYLQQGRGITLGENAAYYELVAAYQSGTVATAGTVPGAAPVRVPPREVAAGLLKEAFDGTHGVSAAGADVAVRPAYSSHIFQIKPEGMDDAGPLAASYTLDRIEVPLPQAPDIPPSNVIAKGVKILIDEQVLSSVLSRQGWEPGLAEISGLEDALLNAQSANDAEKAMDEYIEQQQQRFLEAASQQFSTIEKPSLVRLGPLLRELQHYQGRWNDRPESLRTVSGLTSICGYMLDRHRDDVWLIGERVPGQTPISIDCLIVGLRTVWKEGKSPLCSLDSPPGAMAGVQRSRLVDVPGDSRFARIMLDADYTMKRILFKADGDNLQIEGFRPLERVLQELSERGEVSGHNRFWLTAEQPGDRSILLGPHSLSALFRVHVRVETEEMFVTGDDAVGTGRASQLRAEDARAFTRYFPEISAKRPIFQELDGLYQIALVSRLLRLVAPRNHPVLAGLASLPHERVEVPATYPGLKIEHRRGDYVLEISGGCDLSPRTSTRTFLQVNSASHAALAQTIANAGESTSDTVVAEQSIQLPGTPRAAASDSSQAYLAAMQLLARGDWSGARNAFTRLLDRHPTWAELFERRALALWHLNEWQPAIWDAAMAIRLDPDETEFRVTYLYLRMEAGDDRMLKDLSPALRMALANRYCRRAYADAFENNQRERALAAYDRALTLNPRHADAMSDRGMLWLETADWDKAVADFDAALRIAESDIVRCLRGSARSRLGDRLGAMGDYDEVTQRTPNEYFGWAFRADLRGQMLDFPGAVEDATRAIQIRPNAAEPYITRGSARAAIAEDGPDNARALWRDAAADLRQALERLPEDAPMRPAVEQLLETVRQRLNEASP